MVTKLSKEQRLALKDEARATIVPLTQEQATLVVKGLLTTLPKSHYAERPYGKSTLMQTITIPELHVTVSYCVNVKDPAKKAERKVTTVTLAELGDAIESL
jgi:hypothetical protein